MKQEKDFKQGGLDTLAKTRALDQTGVGSKSKASFMARSSKSAGNKSNAPSEAVSSSAFADKQKCIEMNQPGTRQGLEVNQKLYSWLDHRQVPETIQMLLPKLSHRVLSLASESVSR